MVLYWKKIGLGRCRRSHICDNGGDADDADEPSVMMLVVIMMIILITCYCLPAIIASQEIFALHLSLEMTIIN